MNDDADRRGTAESEREADAVSTSASVEDQGLAQAPDAESVADIRLESRDEGDIALASVPDSRPYAVVDRPLIEMVIAKMRHRNPSMQVIGLSATIGNPKVLAGWLDAELVTSTWRPARGAWKSCRRDSQKRSAARRRSRGQARASAACRGRRRW